MAPTPSLLGPPSLTSPTTAPHSLSSQTPTPPPPSNPFMDQMLANFNTLGPNPSPTPQMMGLTENLSPTYLSTGNPNLDLFFHVVPTTPQPTLVSLLSLSWAHNPLTTLKLICNLRGVRGKGKSNKTGFYHSALWLHKHHPKTLACNLPSFASFGYFKDLPEILFKILGNEHPKKIPKSSSNPPQTTSFRGRRGRGRGRGRKVPFQQRPNVPFKGKLGISPKTMAAKAKDEKHEKRAQMGRKALERYNRDPDYKFLHDRVADLFAAQLTLDLHSLASGKANQISLAAKWCPSLNSSYDRATLLCESVARRVFARERYKEYDGVEEGHYAYRVRDRLRKEVLVPLRKALEIPEVGMSARRWGEVNYNRVASVAMKTYKELFVKHDGVRFGEFLEKVKEGKAKVAAGALLPHEIIKALSEGGGDNGDVAELQWKRMVEDMREVGVLSNCLAVCDVSGSMAGYGWYGEKSTVEPMEVCVALGLLLSELAEKPWKGKVITFSANPNLHVVQGGDLRSKIEFIRRMEWGMNTDFQKVFDKILSVAVGGGLKKEEMVKTVFVFSDMEFDKASSRPWETDYMVIRRKYEEKGYGDCVPQIVFWNLRDSRATPVTGDQKGVALVSGYSKNMMKLFLEGKQDQLNPVAVMEAAIAGEEYKDLVVFD